MISAVSDVSKRKLRDLILNQIYLDENEQTVRERETYIIKDYDSYNNKCIDIFNRYHPWGKTDCKKMLFFNYENSVTIWIK